MQSFILAIFPRKPYTLWLNGRYFLSLLKIKIRIITKEQYNQTLGALAGIDGFPLKEEVYTGDGFTDEMLVFKGFDNALLDRFLVEFKKLHLTRIGLKAVLTEHNINWDSIALHEELLAEDKKMHEN